MNDRRASESQESTLNLYHGIQEEVYFLSYSNTNVPRSGYRHAQSRVTIKEGKGLKRTIKVEEMFKGRGLGR